MTYSVNHWGSHPNAGNDDCWTGAEYSSLEDAEAAFNATLPAGWNPRLALDVHTCTQYVELDGPDVNRVRKNPFYRKPAKDDSWLREHATQVGMAFGCDGYNDAMGY